jgi:dTDP-glucose 4,6-dehydratase
MLDSDSDELVEFAAQHFTVPRYSRILLLGGTGFVGRWLSKTLVQIKRYKFPDIEITVVTRDFRSAQVSLGRDTSALVKFIQHDLTQAPLSFLDRFDIVIHGAVPSTTKTGGNRPDVFSSISTNVEKSVSELVSRHKNKPLVFHLSSGAVYGPQPLHVRNQPETNLLATSLNNPYADSKIQFENSMTNLAESDSIEFCSPRLFTFAGPYLALDQHFAIGNFLQQGLNNEEIVVKGNPLTKRSYLYPTDLIKAILYLISMPSSKPVNIGSDQPLTMEEISRRVAAATKRNEIRFSNINLPATNYVPSCTYLKSRISDWPSVDFSEALDRWIKWLQSNNPEKFI